MVPDTYAILSPPATESAAEANLAAIESFRGIEVPPGVLYAIFIFGTLTSQVDVLKI